MSAHQNKPAQESKKLAYLTRDYMPDAQWTIGGAFRFDLCIYQVLIFMNQRLAARRINRVAGAPPCLWSLDWFSQRRPLNGAAYLKLLDTYTSMGVGITLVFDNPFIREEDLKDNYGLLLVAELAKRNAAHNHAVCVADDRLAAILRQHVPTLPIHCHVNRLLAEPAGSTRDAAFYNSLAQRYNRICLHPADAVRPELYKAIAESARMDVVINDPCLRSCPVRREHLQALADCRRQPYSFALSQRRLVLMNQAGCTRVNGQALEQKKAGNLTKAECRALYEAGYRSFIIQSQQFRNEITLLWEVSQCMFNATPEMSNRIALINSTLLSSLQPNPRVISSGLKDFSRSNFD